jgi:hypothetical protein
MNASPRDEIVFLAPASPPFAPHLGTIYTWCLLDGAARAVRHLGGAAVVPESWNLSSRRLDDQLAGVGEAQREQHYKSLVADAVGATRATQAQFGISMDAGLALRDDQPMFRAEIIALVNELVAEGKIRYMAAPEKWCDLCSIAVPAAAVIQTCFRCDQPLAVHERTDWFLALDFSDVLHRAALTRWQPAYALHRFRDLAGVAPVVRVGHFGRLVGVPSPLDERQILDPRLVAALYPRILRARGYEHIVAAAGQDIQRKWLTLVFATAGSAPSLDVIVNHGVLLSDGGRKMSRYSGATPADLPHDADPIGYRAALLAATLGRDMVASTIAFNDASHLRAKIDNTRRYLAAQPPTGTREAIDVGRELSPILDLVDTHLAALDFRHAYRVFRALVRTELSQRIIPMIRVRGCREVGPAMGRLRSMAVVFFGPEV